MAIFSTVVIALLGSIGRIPIILVHLTYFFLLVQIKIVSTLRGVKLLQSRVKPAESSWLLWDVFIGSTVLIHILLASLQLENVKVKSR